MENPYSSPSLVPGQAPGPKPVPSVVPWYRVYAALMALLYLVLIVGGGAMLIFGDELADEENPAEVFLINGIAFVVVGTPLLIMSVLGVFMPAKRWAWVYGIVLIGLGMTSCCCLPVCVPLLIFWIKPETQAYFGRRQIPPTTNVA